MPGATLNIRLSPDGPQDSPEHVLTEFDILNFISGGDAKLMYQLNTGQAFGRFVAGDLAEEFGLDPLWDELVVGFPEWVGQARRILKRQAQFSDPADRMYDLKYRQLIERVIFCLDGGLISAIWWA